MQKTSSPLVLLGCSHTLPSGLRVRVRLPHGRDRQGLVDLGLRAGTPLSELEARRMVLVHPRSRLAVSAVAWVDGAERLVGFVAGAVGAGAPDVLLTDELLAPGVGDLLARALAEAGGATPRRVA